MAIRLGIVLAIVASPGMVAAQDFTAQISPNPASLTAGGAAADVTVTTTADPSLTTPITYSFSGLPAGITTGGAQVVNAPYPAVTFNFAAGASVAPGTYAGTLMGESGGRIATFPMSVIVAAPDFTLGAAPMAISLSAGGSTMVTISAMGSGDTRGTVSVASMPAPGLSVAPASFDVDIGGMQSVLVSVDPSAPAGDASIVFTGVLPGAADRTVTVSVTIQAPPAPPGADPPQIQSVAPPSVATATRDNVIFLRGLNFQPGAMITSASPGVQITDAVVLGPNAARLVLDVRPNAPPGRIQLNLQNPDGGTTTGEAGLLIYSASSLAAPVAVTGVRIVTPHPWQIIEPGEAVRARALLATSGIGTVVGTWLLDGIPFDRFTRVVTSGYPVVVESAIPIPASVTGERRLELEIESPGTLPTTAVPFLQAEASRSGIRVLAYEDGPGGPTAGPDDPLLRWTLVPGASGYDVEIRSAAAVVVADAPGDTVPQLSTTRRRVTDARWSPDAELLAELGPGPVAVRVRAVFPGEVFEYPTDWVVLDRLGGADGGDRRPDVEGGSMDGGPGPTEPEESRGGPSATPVLASLLFVRAPIEQPERGRGELVLAAQGTFSATESNFDAPIPLGRLQLSGQADARGPVFDLQTTADVAASQDLEDPWNRRGESRNWLLRGGATQPRFREQATLGYAPPSFFDQTEFLTVTTQGGAIQGDFDSPVGGLSFYRSLDLSGNDAFAPFEPEVNAAAYEFSDDAGRYLFRTMLLDATDPGVGDFSAGGEGRAVGAIGVVELGPRLRLLGELATGDFDPGEGSIGEESDGAAFRLAATGASGTLSYGLTLGHTGSGFVNPANPGFTAGSVSDRTRGELTLGKTFGRASLSGTYRHVRGGVVEASGDPKTIENGASLTFSIPVTDVVSISAGGNLNEQRGDAVAALGLPATDRSQKGVNLSITETVGAVSLTQSFTWQDFTDQALPLSDQRVTGFSLTGYGAPTSYLRLSANVATTEIQSAPELGTTDQFVLSLQPNVSISRWWLEVGPRVAFTRVSNDLFDSESKADLYQVVARWSPEWLNRVLSMEVAGDWSRRWTDLDPEPPPFRRNLVFTLGLNWRTNHTWPGS